MWTTSWFWIILAVVTLLVGITVEILTRNQTSRRAVIYRVLVTMLVVPAVFYGIQRVVEAPERAAEALREEKRTEFLTYVAAHVGNPDAAKELIEFRARDLFSTSPGDAERFAHELWTQLPKKQALYKALQDDSAKEAMKRRLDWEPVLRAFLEQFDHRVAALQARSIVHNVSTSEVVLVQPGPRQQPDVRYLRTTGGYELRVRVTTGQVDLGKLTSFPSFDLVGTTRLLIRGDTDRYFMTVRFGPDSVNWDLGIGPDDRRSGGHIIGRDSQTEEYRQAVRDGLNLAFEYAVLFTTK